LPRAEDLRPVDLAEGVAGPLGPERGTGGLDPPANPGATNLRVGPFQSENAARRAAKIEMVGTRRFELRTP
jgi:hypothetical protein